jgi:glucose/arabinose dehydrogenase
VALRDGTLYAAVGSTCDACVETDPTRATIGRVENGTYAPVAVHIRNAIALTVNPNTGSLWAGVAGEDYLPIGHPYEIFDDVSSHAPPANYGWPYCYEAQRRNPVARWQGHDCGGTVVPRVVLPAYETPIGAAFYPRHARGKFSFAAQYAGGAFITLHGSWHGPAQGLSGYVPPRVVFVPMNGDAPKRPVNWSDPSTQWTPFVTGYQEGSRIARSGRPTGIAVGPQGDLFIADDQTGAIYRVRPR